MFQYYYEKSPVLRRVLWLSNLGMWILLIILVIVYTQDQAHQSGEGWSWLAFFLILIANPLHWMPGIVTVVLSYLAIMKLASKNGDEY